jgi:hypothetical protein
VRPRGLLLFLSIAAGCGSGEGEPITDASPAPDSGPSSADASERDAVPASDGGLVEDASEPPDAGFADAAPLPDSGPPPPDAGFFGVTVLVQGIGRAPRENIDVVFSAADGTLFSHVLTDSMGRAHSDLPAGGMVTALRSNPFFAETRAGALPPETIVFHDFEDAQPMVRTEVTATIPGAASGASVYSVATGCDEQFTQPPSPAVLSVFDTCVTSSDTFSIVAQALRHEASTGSVAIAHSIVRGIQVSGSAQSMTLPAWSTSFDTSSITPVNPPPSAGSFYWDGMIRLDGQSFATYGSDGAQDLAMSAPAPFELSFPRTALIDGIETRYSLISADQRSVTLLRETTDTISPAMELDLARRLLPFVGGLAVIRGNPGRPVMNWTPEAGLAASADQIRLELAWQRREEFHTWRAIVPPNLTSFQLPAMPESLGTRGPWIEIMFSDASVSYLDGSSVTSFEEVRRGTEVTPPTSAVYRESTTFGP